MDIERIEERCCYICWDETTTADDPVRRDCGCNGTAGWVHASCLISSVKTSSGASINLLDPLLRPWTKCRQCLQPFKDPTKRKLERAMLGSRTKRIVSSVLHCIKTVAILSLYCSITSCLNFCADLTLPWIESMLSRLDLNPTLQATGVAVLAIPVVAVLFHHRHELQQNLPPALALTCAVVVFALAVEGSILENGTIFGSCLAVLAGVVYHLRADIRREAMDMRRRGLAGILSFLVNFSIGYIVAEMSLSVDRNIQHLLLVNAKTYLVDNNISLGRFFRYQEMISTPQQPLDGMSFNEYWRCCV